MLQSVIGAGRCTCAMAKCPDRTEDEVSSTLEHWIERPCFGPFRKECGSQEGGRVVMRSFVKCLPAKRRNRHPPAIKVGLGVEAMVDCLITGDRCVPIRMHSRKLLQGQFKMRIRSQTARMVNWARAGLIDSRNADHTGRKQHMVPTYKRLGRFSPVVCHRKDLTRLAAEFGDAI